MKNSLLLISFLSTLCCSKLAAQKFSKAEVSRYQQHAKNVNIIRDNFGIPHIYGKSDADAVFGLLFAQCEDDFNRVETNYIEKLGRLAEVNGEKNLYDDLLIRMVIDSADAISDYKNSPPWLHKLLDAFADGVNYYLYAHPNVKPHLLTHFEPWYALLWTDGSIGSITTADFTAKDLKNLYGTDMGMRSQGSGVRDQDYDDIALQEKLTAQSSELLACTGSNGFAFSPSITESKNAILYINPHVSFYYRPEVQVVSEEGLNAYGAVTWGQFFIYQGFNEHCGWMHTSSHADVSDAYIEKVSTENNKRVYEYDGKKRDVITKNITLRYLTNKRTTNNEQQTTIKALYTHHGPIMGKRNGKLCSVRSNNRSMTSLIQSWQRTKAKSYDEFRKILFLKANASNNEVYADAEGNIAYWHGNFMPIRDKNLNWNKPVDGTTSATEWKGLHMVDELVQCINPKNGWLQNCNSSAFTVAGDNSPKKENYPSYMAPDGENYRGVLAVRILPEEKNYTLDKVIAKGYNPKILFFENLIPALIRHYDKLIATDEGKADSVLLTLTSPLSTLRGWDFSSGENSVATTLAVNWGSKLMEAINATINLDDFDDQVTRTEKFAVSGDPKIFISTFAATIADLNKIYGTWNKPWGEINRFQRINDEIDWKFDDSKPSTPVGYTSSQWGQIASFRSIRTEGTKKFYGVNGNSFICAVEFGKRIKAKSLLAGGECGDSTSKHFTDQLDMYAHGQFKEVLFYKEDVMKHVEREYRPGE